MRIDFIPDFVRTYLVFYCPECREKLEVAYISQQVFVCLKCNVVYELHLRKSEYTVEKVKEDGWLKVDKEVM
mgnify:CR=1 FL=1